MVAVHVDRGSQPDALPVPGASVEVRLFRGRLATRFGRVLDVRGGKSVTTGTVVGVQWDDDGSVSWLVPGLDIQVTGI
jgi:hypothetical protein